MLYSAIGRLSLGPDERSLTEFFLAAIGRADRITLNHSLMVSRLSEILCRAMCLNGQTPKVVLAALFHDIGKIGVEGRCLAHDGPLDPDEVRALQSHTTLGGQALSRMFECETVTLVACHHHEKYDGTGYPAGLAGDEIPLPARIVGLIDAYDAIRAKRNYSPARNHDDAVACLVSARGTHFDPAVVDAFVRSEREVSAAFNGVEAGFAADVDISHH